MALQKQQEDTGAQEAQAPVASNDMVSNPSSQSNSLHIQEDQADSKAFNLELEGKQGGMFDFTL